MRSLLSLCLLSFLSLDSTSAQDFHTGFDTPEEQAGWEEYRLGASDPFYLWEYQASTIGAPTALVHYYPVGGQTPTDDWFVSPVMDLSAGGMIDSLWHKFSGFGMPMAGDTLAIYILDGAPDPELANTITAIYNYTDSNYVNDNVWHFVTAIPIPAQSTDQSHIAFRYHTTVNWLDVNFDELHVSLNSASAVDELLPESLMSVFPVPFDARLSWSLSDGLELKRATIMDLRGRKVLSSTAAEQSISTAELGSGIYFLVVMTDKGVIRKRLVKE